MEYDASTELAIYHAQLEAQHEELTEANLLVNQQLQALKVLFYEAPVAYFVVENGVIVRRWNAAATELGLHSHLVPGVFFTNLFMSSDHYQLREWLLTDSITEPLMVVATHNPDLYSQLDKKILSHEQQTLISVTDITARRQAERDAQLQRSQAFAYLAHELRTPVATIAMTLENDPELAAMPNGQVIKAANDQTLAVMEDLRTVVSPDTDTYTLKAPLELKSLLSDVTDVVQPQMEAAGVQCRLELASLPAEEVWLTANEHAISQVVVNLLKNVAVHSQAHRAWVECVFSWLKTTPTSAV